MNCPTPFSMATLFSLHGSYVYEGLHTLPTCVPHPPGAEEEQPGGRLRAGLSPGPHLPPKVRAVALPAPAPVPAPAVTPG